MEAAGAGRATALGRCSVCGSPLQGRPDVYDAVTARSFGLAGCEECGTRCVLGVVPGEIPSFYPPDYGAHGEGDGGLVTRLRTRLIDAQAGAGWRDRVLRRLGGGLVPGIPPQAPRPGARLLDVGCGSGDRTEPLARLGWELHGTELDPTARARAEARGLVIHDPDLTRLPDGAFGCVRLWHSLEHLLDPRAALVECRRVLGADGLLVIGIPNSSGVLARLFGVQWHHFDAPRHLFHFTRDSLVRLLRSTGFEPTRVRTYSDRGVVGSLERLAIATGRQADFKDRLPLVLLEAPVNLGLRWLGLGDMLDIQARPALSGVNTSPKR